MNLTIINIHYLKNAGACLNKWQPAKPPSTIEHMCIWSGVPLALGKQRQNTWVRGACSEKGLRWPCWGVECVYILSNPQRAMWEQNLCLHYRIILIPQTSISTQAGITLSPDDMSAQLSNGPKSMKVKSHTMFHPCHQDSTQFSTSGRLWSCVWNSSVWINAVRDYFFLFFGIFLPLLERTVEVWQETGRETGRTEW